MRCFTTGVVILKSGKDQSSRCQWRRCLSRRTHLRFAAAFPRVCVWHLRLLAEWSAETITSIVPRQHELSWILKLRMIPESAKTCLLQCICRKPKIGPINFVQLITRRGNCQLEQLVSRNSRCAVSKCFQETLGISASEDGLLHRLLVRTTFWLLVMQDTMLIVFAIWWLLLGQPYPVSLHIDTCQQLMRDKWTVQWRPQAAVAQQRLKLARTASWRSKYT